MGKKLADYLRYKSLEEIVDWAVDWTAAIVHDEFHKKESRFSPEKLDYRERAIDRLVKDRVSWGANNNIDWNVAKRYVKIVCPYCFCEMKFHGSSGSMYKCDCGAVANPNLGVYFTPPNKE